MALTIAATAELITVTATDEDLDFTKIAAQVNTLSDDNNKCVGKSCSFTKKLYLTGNQAVDLGTSTSYSFTGNNRFLAIGTSFTSVTCGKVIEGKRVGTVSIAFNSNVSDGQNTILNNTAETHLVLALSADGAEYTRYFIRNTNPASTLELKFSDVDLENSRCYLKGGWAGTNEVTMENASYAAVDSNWFNITSCVGIGGFKTLPDVAYPAAGYKFAGATGKFANVNANAFLDGLVADIGIGTTGYIFHPAFSSRKVVFRYDFNFIAGGASLAGGKLSMFSGNTVFKDQAIAAGNFTISNVELMRADTRNGTGGSGGYSAITFEEFNRKSGAVVVRKAGVLEITKAYVKAANVKKFEIQLDGIADEHFTNTASTVTEISTLNILYDMIQYEVAANFSIPQDIVKIVGEKLIIKDGFSIKAVRLTGTPFVDQSLQAEGIVITGNIISVRVPTGGMKKTDDLTTITGSVDDTFNGITDALYIKEDGKIDVRCIIGTAGVNACWGIWKDGEDRSTMVTASDIQTLPADPNTAYYFVCDAVHAYRSKAERFVTGAYGEELFIELVAITKTNGQPIIPLTLTTEQTAIADMAIYNASTGRVDIKLPTDYATNSRWDSTNKVWRYTAEDFKAFAFKIENIQSGQNALRDVATVRVEDYALVLSHDSSLVFEQHADNVDCEVNLEAWTTRREGGGNKKFYNDGNGTLTFSKGPPIVATMEGVGSKEEIIDGILNVNYGKLSDGTTDVGAGTLGEHWLQFYPPEIVRQILESPLNGSTSPTRYQTSPGTYGAGTLGDALRNIVAIKTAVKDG